ncbi:endonuclease/exonuclease/phosphatase family protein [Nereida sp. MMG025]|uniref:endonuclease/exonuclease/phosphatase family protein n=1 Tax=Nereida sp. MMG025 TaxID=2909981 RepID=UPI001F2B687A|nr:endonuclease/exonuclease/phosphatase family protein [Nereida sp. MMG025]MCF6445699.1 endonuclease/exonuclease/phosphatase family protein [Nereida sp. MMG025]
MKIGTFAQACTIALTTALAAPVLADAPRVMTWNINGGEQDKDVLAGNARDMILDIGDLDILVLQEVISSEQVSEIAEEIGFDHWAISDFSPPIEVTGKWFASLEVAILSRTPFSKVVEWDTTGRLPTGDPYDPRASDTTVPTESLDLELTISDGERPSRGFLRVDLDGGLSVYATHWKSSRGANGDEDLENAAKRENNARGIAKDASTILANGGSVIIAGDLNIQPIGKHDRVGSDLAIDCKPSLNNCGDGGTDGYDDSMAILADLENGYRLLSEEVQPTYLGGNFGPGAIDHIAVAGPLAAFFALATTVSVSGNSYFGSDHSPVFSGVGTDGGAILRTNALASGSGEDRDAKVQRLIQEIRDRLEVLEQMSSENQ